LQTLKKILDKETKQRVFQTKPSKESWTKRQIKEYFKPNPQKDLGQRDKQRVCFANTLKS